MSHNLLTPLPTGKRPLRQSSLPEEVFLPSLGGYADILKGRLVLEIDYSPARGSNKRYCKPAGFSDQGYRED